MLHLSQLQFWLLTKDAACVWMNFVVSSHDCWFLEACHHKEGLVMQLNSTATVLSYVTANARVPWLLYRLPYLTCHVGDKAIAAAHDSWTCSGEWEKSPGEQQIKVPNPCPMKTATKYRHQSSHPTHMKSHSLLQSLSVCLLVYMGSLCTGEIISY